MPTATFWNLPDEKRQALIDIAIDEFAEHAYDTASVSRIVARAGIAKGSIYQYFRDKQELFLYLLEYAAQRQLALLGDEQPPDPQMGFFAMLRAQMSASTQVGLADLRLVKLMYRAYYDPLPFHDESLSRIKTAGREHLGQLVRQGMARGDIDPQLDPDLATFLISAISTELGPYVLARLGRDPQQTTWAGLAELNTEAVEGIFDQVVRILERGLAAPGAPGRPQL